MEMQPVVTDTVTVHRMAESNTAGWPSTLFRVIHVGVEITGLGAEGSDMRIPRWLPSATLLSTHADLALLQGESGAERQVQCLQFPCCKTGCELPANTLLTFLDAVGQCCSQGNSKKPGTLLSLSRCRRQTPCVNLGYGSKGSLPQALSPLLHLPGFGRALAWLANQVPSIISQSLELTLISSCPWTRSRPQRSHI